MGQVGFIDKVQWPADTTCAAVVGHGNFGPNNSFSIAKQVAKGQASREAGTKSQLNRTIDCLGVLQKLENTKCNQLQIAREAGEVEVLPEMVKSK